MVNRQSDTGNGECLSEDLLSGYLEGTLTPVVKAACEVHLISCDECRQKLADFMRVLQPEISEQEMAMVNAAIDRWQQRDLRPIPVQSVRPLRSVYYAFAALAAVLIVGVIVRVSFFSTPVGEEVVQQRFLAGPGRPLEAQMANQPYREFVSPLRGPGDLQLIEADEDLLKRAQAYERGRVYLVNKDYEKAIDDLKTASQYPNVSSNVLNDLGVAYLERNESDQDLDEAERLFRRVRDRDEKYLPAIFNLWLLYERQEKNQQALSMWQEYQNLDSESEWAEEIRVKQEEDSRK